MKALVVPIVALVLAACSFTGGKQPPSPDVAPRLAESALQESGGALHLTFDAQGNWVKITSEGTASLNKDTPSGRETALMIATMRAKRMLTEFLRNDVQSTKTLTRVARSYAQVFLSEDSESPEASASHRDSGTMDDLDIEDTGTRSERARQAERFASIVTERVQDNSAAILRGAYVSHRAFGDGQVLVGLTTTRESIEAAHHVSRAMRGGLK